MATSKRRTPARKSPSSRRTTAKASPSAKSARSKTNPYFGPAIATGAVAAIAGVLAGAWFFRKSDKSLAETAEGISGRIKDGIHEARAKATDSARSFKDKAAMFFAEDPAETVTAERKTSAVSD